MRLVFFRRESGLRKSLLPVLLGWFHQRRKITRIVSPESKSRRIRVEQLRELEKSFQVSVEGGKWKIGVIRDAERMNLEAQNAFLKTLEEPPQRTLLILITSKPQALLPTVHSRMTKIQLNTPAEQRDQLGESEQKLQLHLDAFVNSHHTMADALALRGGFSQILVEQKELISKSFDAVLKEEVTVDSVFVSMVDEGLEAEGGSGFYS